MAHRLRARPQGARLKPHQRGPEQRLLGIAFWQFSHLRQKAHRRHEELCWPISREHERIQQSDPQVEARDVLAALKALPEWASDVLLLVGEGLTGAEIAVLCGISIEAVAGRISRARQRFAALLAKRRH